MKSYGQSQSFIAKVDALGIPRYEPFTGMSFGCFTVVGPSEKFYEKTLTEYQSDSDLDKADAFLKRFDEPTAVQLLNEASGHHYVIDDDEDNTPTNESSVILFAGIDNLRLLFTGDAGVRAITDARSAYQISDLDWIDVPHHGSKHNVNSEMLAYFKAKTAFISATRSQKHPSQSVVDALKRNGATVYSTGNSGGGLRQPYGMPDRAGWSTATSH